MAKNQKEAMPAIELPVAAQANVEPTPAVEEKQVEAKVEVPVVLTEHPDMCSADLFGTYDASSDYCKDCLKEFTACATACAILKASKNIKAAKAPRAPRAEGTVKTGGTRGVKVLISGADSGAGKIDLLLCRPEGCTMEEMIVHRDAVHSHLSHLVRAGFPIVHENGRYYYRPAAPVTAAPAA